MLMSLLQCAWDSRSGTGVSGSRTVGAWPAQDCGCECRCIGGPRMRVPMLFMMLLLLLTGHAHGEEDNPLAGNDGYPPPGYPTQVNISATVQRLLSVDQQNYIFHAIFVVTMAWRDPKAKDAVVAATANQKRDGCARLCYHAESPFSNGRREMMCCDGFWTPSLYFRNVVKFPQERTSHLRRIFIDFQGDIVAWMVSTHGIFYTPMNFKKFPFDKQDLRIICSCIHNRSDVLSFQPTGMSLEGLEQQSTDPSGWHIIGSEVQVQPIVHTYEFYSWMKQGHPNDPQPLSSHQVSDYTLATSHPLNVWVYAVEIQIKVSRLYFYHVLAILVPIFGINLGSFIIFAIDPEDLGTRIGIVVTLLLSLVGTQFVVNSRLPSSSYMLPTQQLILLSYVSMTFLCFESLIVHRVTKFAEKQKQESQRSAGSARLKALWIGLKMAKVAASESKRFGKEADMQYNGLKASSSMQYNADGAAKQAFEPPIERNTLGRYSISTLTKRLRGQPCPQVLAASKSVLPDDELRSADETPYNSASIGAPKPRSRANLRIVMSGDPTTTTRGASGMSSGMQEALSQLVRMKKDISSSLVESGSEVSSGACARVSPRNPGRERTNSHSSPLSYPLPVFPSQGGRFRMRRSEDGAVVKASTPRASSSIGTHDSTGVVCTSPSWPDKDAVKGRSWTKGGSLGRIHEVGTMDFGGTADLAATQEKVDSDQGGSMRQSMGRIQEAHATALNIPTNLPAINTEGTAAQAINTNGAGAQTINLKVTAPQAINAKGTAPQAINAKGTAPPAINTKGTAAQAIITNGAAAPATTTESSGHPSNINCTATPATPDPVPLSDPRPVGAREEGGESGIQRRSMEGEAKDVEEGEEPVIGRRSTEGEAEEKEEGDERVLRAGSDEVIQQAHHARVKALLEVLHSLRHGFWNEVLKDEFVAIHLGHMVDTWCLRIFPFLWLLVALLILAAPHF